MKFKLVEGLKNEGKEVAFSCSSLNTSRSGYYKWSSRPLSARKQDSEYLSEEIKKVWNKSRKTYGAPRIHAELKDGGKNVGLNRVAKIMRLNKIQGAGQKKFRPKTVSSEHVLSIAPRLFKVEELGPSNLLPNQIWVGDITYIPTDAGFSYLAVLMDLRTRKIVGYSLGNSLHSQLVINALDQAIGREMPNKGLTIHTDRGVQYSAQSYREKLSENSFLASMSRQGNCYDNAFVESFFRSLKVELIYTKKFKDLEMVRKEIFDYIEVWYNRQRRHSSLAYLSPINYEKQIALVS